MSTTDIDTTKDGRGPFAWFHTLGRNGKRAFVGAFGGYGLDAYDFQVLPLGLFAITAYFGLTTGEAGLLTTVTLVVSAVMAALFSLLAITSLFSVIWLVGAVAVIVLLFTGGANEWYAEQSRKGAPTA